MPDNTKTNILTQSLGDIINALDYNVMPSPNNKLAHRLLLTIERKRATMEWLIQHRSKGHVKQRTRKVLWWAMAEILWMDGVPDAAVVDTAVTYVKKKHSVSESSYVNAFLRNIVRDIEAKGQESLTKNAPPYVQYDLPPILWKRWVKTFGEKETMGLAKTLQIQAKPVMRLKTWPKKQYDMPAGLLSVNPPEWAPWATLFTPGESIKSLDNIMAEGSPFYIQDMATLLAPALLDAKPGEDIADLCCAPGGKARIIAEMMKGQGRLLCADKLEAKIQRVRQNMDGIENADFSCLDASTAPFQPAVFDAVLLDVPCSNTGVIRRKPDVRWGFSEDKLAGLIELQAAILDNVANAVKNNGRIVYSTCSIEPEENTLQVKNFIRKHPEFALVSSRTIMPDKEHDGAFAALLKKTL